MARWSSRAAAAELAQVHDGLAELIDLVGQPRLGAPTRGPHAGFRTLSRAIVFQQLAGAAASTIHGRFVALFDGAEPSPGATLALGEERLRSAGLSGAKTASILDLAQRCLDGRLRPETLGRLDDQAVTEHLCTVRGIGPWTAQMHLMHQLRRPDVWPVGDLGVRRGWALIDGWATDPTPDQLEEAGEVLRPWRSVAAWYCWRAVDVWGDRAITPPAAGQAPSAR